MGGNTLDLTANIRPEVRIKVRANSYSKLTNKLAIRIENQSKFEEMVRQ